MFSFDYVVYLAYKIMRKNQICKFTAIVKIDKRKVACVKRNKSEKRSEETKERQKS